MCGDVIPPFDEPSPVLFLWCHPPPVDSTELGLDPEDMCFCCSFTSLFQRLGGVLNESVPVGLPHSYNRDVHPSCLRLLEAVLATGRPDPSCIAIKPALLQLPIPAAAYGSRALLDQPSTSAKALVNARRRAVAFACAPQATSGSPASTFVPGPSYYIKKN